MSDYCHSCRSFHRPSKHLQVFLVQQVEDIGSKFPTIVEVHAVDAELAAERWAEDDDCDSAEYGILRGDDAEVVVTAADGTKTRWKVMGESEPTYYASQIEEGGEDE